MYFSRVRVNPDISEMSHFHHILSGNGYSVHQLLWDLFPGAKERTFLFREEIAGEQTPHYKGARGEPVFYTVSQNEPTEGYPLFTVESKTYMPRLVAGDRLSFKLRANPTIARKAAGKKNSVRHDVVMDAQYHQLRELARGAGVDDSGEKSDLKERILSSWLTSKNPDFVAKLELILDSNERYRAVEEQRRAPPELLNLALKAAADSALEAWMTKKGKTHGFTVVRDEKRKLLKFQAEGYRWHALSKKGRSAGFSSVDFEGEIEVTDPVPFVEALFKGIGRAKAFGCGLMLVRRMR